MMNSTKTIYALATALRAVYDELYADYIRPGYCSACRNCKEYVTNPANTL
jgi:hypothetical protein